MLALLAFLGLLTDHRFAGKREIASDCNEAFASIIHRQIPLETELRNAQLDSPEIRHFQFTKTLWNKIISTKDFETFDEDEYFRLLEIYKDERQTGNLLSPRPTGVEGKLALIEAIYQRKGKSFSHPAIMDEIEALNAFKLRKLAKLLKNFDLSKKLTRDHLEDFSAEFFLILKGPPVSVFDYISRNKTQKMQERLFRVLQEDMLTKGLKGTLERIPERAAESRYENVQLFIKKVMKYKAWRLLVLPYDLPWIDRVKISDGLLEKILLDGLDTHHSELIMELKHQNAIDHYDRIRKVYRPVAFGVGFIYSYHYWQNALEEAEKRLEEENEKAKQAFLAEFEKLQDSINAGVTREKTDDELKEEQFQRVLKSFRERYKQDPTPEEYQELRKKIFGA